MPSSGQVKHSSERLRGGPQHPDATMTVWGVHPDIGEIEVKCDKHSVFGDTRRENGPIRGSCEPLGVRRLDVVPKIAQRELKSCRSILIELESKSHPDA